MEYWSGGVLEWWSIGVVEYWSIGASRNTGTASTPLDGFGHRNIGMPSPHHPITPFLHVPGTPERSRIFDAATVNVVTAPRAIRIAITEPTFSGPFASTRQSHSPRRRRTARSRRRPRVSCE